jgi:glycyl-tRNA synthetase
MTSVFQKRRFMSSRLPLPTSLTIQSAPSTSSSTIPLAGRELYGLAYRTDFDLKAHSAGSNVDLSYYDEEAKARFVPHCIEPSFGVDRTVLAVLSEAYREDELGGEKRVYLKLSSNVAPIKVAVFPLLKNKEALTNKAHEVHIVLRKEFGAVQYDETGSIGKRSAIASRTRWARLSA